MLKGAIGQECANVSMHVSMHVVVSGLDRTHRSVELPKAIDSTYSVINL